MYYFTSTHFTLQGRFGFSYFPNVFSNLFTLFTSFESKTVQGSFSLFLSLSACLSLCHLTLSVSLLLSLTISFLENKTKPQGTHFLFPLSFQTMKLKSSALQMETVRKPGEAALMESHSDSWLPFSSSFEIWQTLMGFIFGWIMFIMGKVNSFLQDCWVITQAEPLIR